VDVPVWPPDVDAGRINRALPDDIRVRAVTAAPAGFDARFSALWRRYTYRVADDPRGPDPLVRHLALQWGRPLDLGAMNDAARALIGEHDFAPFCRQRPFASTVRAIHELAWHRDTDDLAVMTIRADAFCHSMVRSLVGVLLPVGDGRRPTDWPGSVLASGGRDSAVTTMPAHPLVLEEVGYPAEELLHARQGQTRALRG
jgi:tRNA pseudouridine38-40 synthase